jgi:hypothetical protein
VSEQMLVELLDRVVPVSERGRSDWEEVMAIAGEPSVSERRRRNHRRRYLVLAAALAVAILLVTPAFGVRDRIVDLVTRDDRDFGTAAIAPTVVQRDFSELSAGAPEGMDPRVLPLQTRLVARVRVEGQERDLWAAPTARGGFCFLIEGGYGGCQRNGGYLPPIAPTIVALQKPGSDSTVLEHIGGTVTSRRITTVLIQFRDGVRVPVNFTYVSAPIEAGFFGYDVPTTRRNGERGPVAVIGLDRDGLEVWRDDSPGRTLG